MISISLKGSYRVQENKDYILVINIGGYIDKSTRSEIEYAKTTEKTVRYLEPMI